MKQAEILLVIECVARYDWREVFDAATLEDGTAVEVEQAEWDDLSVVSYDTALTVTRRKTRDGREQRTFTPKYVLMRSESKGHWGQDSTAKLMALIHSNVGCMNSTFSIANFLHKPVIWQALKEVQAKLGKEDFPLISQTLYPSFKEMIVSPDVPFVLKIGSFDAGKGKAVVRTPEQFEDLRSIVAVQPAYSTAETFVDWDWDGRIQVIGPHVRVFKRTTAFWKGNQGRGATIEDLPVTPQFQRWVDVCRQIFGGIELFGIDFLHCKQTDRLFILELNGTACGLVHRHAEEDMRNIRDVLLAKWNASRTAKQQPATNAPSEVPVLQEQIRRLIVQNVKLQQEIEEMKKK